MKKQTANHVLGKIAALQKKAFEIRDAYLEKRIKNYKDEYYIRFHREPKDIEVQKFKKDIIMKFGLLLYFTAIVLLFVVWLSIRESGVFG